MFALVFTSGPASLSFNWAVTIESRGLGSSYVTLHWSALASIDSHGVSSGTGPLGGEFPHIRRKYLVVVAQRGL